MRDQINYKASLAAYIMQRAQHPLWIKFVGRQANAIGGYPQFCCCHLDHSEGALRVLRPLRAAPFREEDCGSLSEVPKSDEIADPVSSTATTHTSGRMSSRIEILSEGPGRCRLSSGSERSLPSG